MDLDLYIREGGGVAMFIDIDRGGLKKKIFSPLGLSLV